MKPDVSGKVPTLSDVDGPVRCSSLVRRWISSASRLDKSRQVYQAVAGLACPKIDLTQ